MNPLIKLSGLVLTLALLIYKAEWRALDATWAWALGIASLVFLDAQAIAEARHWSQAGAWIRSVISPAVLPFYALLAGVFFTAGKELPVQSFPPGYRLGNEPVRMAGPAPLSLSNRGPTAPPTASGSTAIRSGPTGTTPVPGPIRPSSGPSIGPNPSAPNAARPGPGPSGRPVNAPPPAAKGPVSTPASNPDVGVAPMPAPATPATGASTAKAAAANP